MHPNARARMVPMAVAVAVSLMLAGCSAAESFDKAGGSGPVALRMANVYGGLHLEPGVQAFVDAVDTASDGAMSIDVVSDWGSYPPDAEQQLVADVAAGEADLGWTGTRVFDLLDVSAFAPLTAPMLIDGYALQDAVIESDIPTSMLDALEPLGVTGIAVLGGALRKPFAASAPLVAAEDWNGVTVQAFPSNGHAASIRALGATPTDVLWADLDDGVTDGDIRGFEKGLLIARTNALHQLAPFVTTNVNLWPETSAIIANPARMAQLTAEQRAWLIEAGEIAAAASSELYDDAAELETLCDGGARAIEASLEQLAELEAAVAPVVETVRAGEGGSAVDRIEALKAKVPPDAALPIPAGCTGPPVSDDVPSGEASGDAPEDLDGVYRWVLTAELAMAHGTASDKTAEGQAGYPVVATMTLDDGTWTMQGDDGDHAERGTFSVDGTTITFDWPRVRATLVWDYTADADGTLHLTPLDVPDEGDRWVWGTVPWQKVG
jgi:TRAP-type transport system periplasmic protein